MRKKLISRFVFTLILHLSCSSYANISQLRFPNETYQQAIDRVKNHITANEGQNIRWKATPEGRKVPVTEIDYSLVPEIVTVQELHHLFYIIRDTRFLYTKENPEFPRRISWLYPDDGCFARAALSGMKLKEEQLTRPVKIFVFGDLEVQTPYSAHGYVTWWYHVAEAVRYMGEVYVLDPAINGKIPLLVDDWFNLMGSKDDLEGIVCNAYTYDPFDDCFNATRKSDRHARRDQLIYLKKEWMRMSSLGFDPILVLGNNPPWLDFLQ